MAERILIGAPVRQKPLILACFLQSLRTLRREGLEVDYFFIDDNEEQSASQLLATFATENPRVFVERVEPAGEYVCDGVTHRWSRDLVWRVAAHKNRLIAAALEQGYDRLFLVDSDLVLHPATLLQLCAAGKEIVAEIFWTEWQPGCGKLPQVWGCDHYTLYEILPGERVAPEEALLRQQRWLERLAEPGLYRVGGLGACTLIARGVLEKGIDFSPLYNLSFWGEDRHFCLRAVAHGCELFVDTCCPAFHFYRETDLPEALDYMHQNGIVTGDDRFGEWHRVLDCARRALIFRGSTGCYAADPEVGLGCFDGALQELVRDERAGLLEEVRRGKYVAFTEVPEMSLGAADGTTATVRAKVKSFGILGERNFITEQAATVKLAKKGGEWRVTDLDFKPAPRREAPQRFPWGQRVAKATGNRITLAMVVRNEADRFLRLVLEQAREIVDDAVVIDDGSTDATPEVVREVLQGLPLKLVRNEGSLFARNEAALRRMLWEETVKTGPDWILCLDADELFEAGAAPVLRRMVNQADFDYYAFRLYDFWTPEDYREEPLWSAHFRYFVLLVRYQPFFPYTWSQNPLHCGRFPANVTLLPGIQSALRVKHLGWMRPADRLSKYLRYRQLDPEGVWGIKEQYETILDAFPRLVRWRE